MIATYSFTAGLLVRKSIRTYLEKAQFTGDIRFIEHKGWLESEFTVKGSNGDVGRIVRMLQSYARQLDASPDPALEK